MRLLTVLAVLALAAAGCSAAPEGSSTSRRRAGAKDAGETSPDEPVFDSDSGVISRSDGGSVPPPGGDYAAPHPAFPEIVKQAGSVIASPKFVAITFPNDDLRSQIESFVGRVGATEYWATIASEYGVGPAAAGTPVHLNSNAPDQIDDEQVKTFLKVQLAAGNLGTFDPSTIYAIFYPQKTSITLQNVKSCSSFGGYHSETTLGDGRKAVYAVIPRCPIIAGLTGIDAVTTSTSHELVEAATDPYFFTAPAWQAPSDEHVAWPLILGGGENSDLCAQNEGTHFKPDGFEFTVQRSWSNAAARAGTDPCVPARPGVYFNAAPVLPDMITLENKDTTAAVRSFSIKGVQLTPGQSKTIELALFSLAPTSGEWKLAALDQSALHGGQPQLEFTFSKPSGKNGDKVQLTIKALTSTAAGAPFVIQSRLDGQTNLFVGMAGQ